MQIIFLSGVISRISEAKNFSWYKISYVSILMVFEDISSFIKAADSVGKYATFDSDSLSDIWVKTALFVKSKTQLLISDLSMCRKYNFF